ncbi:MAG: XRE family transcriptional regulator, partial [Acidobacteria bacterium]
MAVDREALARALREARQNRGMSQEAAAKHVGLSRTVLTQIELGNRPVSSDELSKLAGAYRRPVKDFLPPTEVDEGDLLARVFSVEPSLPGRLRPDLEHVVSLC